MASSKEREAFILTIFGLASLILVGSLYWLIDDNKFEKFALVGMTICAVVISVGSSKIFAIRYGTQNRHD